MPVGVRVSERVIGAYFAWTTLLALALAMQPGMQARVLVANAGVAAVYALVWRLRDRDWMAYARDWIPQACMILAYKQMGWFAAATHVPRFELAWIVWDRTLLDTLHLRTAIESLGWTLPLLIELSYTLVYAVPPAAMGIIYALGMRRKADAFLTIYILGLVLSYGQFPFWPSEPPRTVFPGEDGPGVWTPVRAFNLWLVGNQGIHTSVFPSAHVSGVWAAAMAMRYVMRWRRLLVAGYFFYAILVALATVYGRYHYAADAAAGLVVALVARMLGGWLLPASPTMGGRGPAAGHGPARRPRPTER